MKRYSIAKTPLKMKKSLFITGLVIFNFILIQSSYAEVKLPAIVSSNMVLQRNTTITLWGWADANEKISISTSWLNESLSLKADIQGNWKVDIKTTNSKDSQTIKIVSADSNITLENILFGEVWLCSGQSNMYQPLKGYTGQPTFGGPLAILNAKNTNLRLFSVDKIGSKTPSKDLQKYTPWQSATSESVADFSAVAYFFGQKLQETLDVPVGMIHTSWGGSKIEAWISNDVLSNYQNIDLENVDINKQTQHIPTVLFNAMINPITNYKIKGALWYQGESNRKGPKLYEKLCPAMVKDWRTRWNIGDFPFYYVQIAPYNYEGNDKFQTTDNSAFIRESQLKCLDLIPNSGIAITMDIGHPDFIHPPKKKEVADRLLFNALNQTYGYKSIDYKTPIFNSQELKDNGLILKFKNAENGLYTYDTLKGFEIAGEDKIFYPADAEIINRKHVFVKSKKVENPVAVRYAWKNFINGTLFSTSLLPASSFRTDNWNDATQAK